MSQTYPLVVYGPQGEPHDVVDAADEAAWTAKGYRRHWHMGGTYGLPEMPVTPDPVVPDAPPPSARRSKKLTPPARPAKE
jgi:hypothetical protein